MIAKNTPSGPELMQALSLRANHGVLLSRCGEHGLLARPLTGDGNPDPTAEAQPLPPVPARFLETGANLLRHAWRVRRASAVWWFYADPKGHRWTCHCPPQLCSETSIEVDATFRNCQTPDPNSWLAGSFRSVPPGMLGDRAALWPLLPSHQGIHFVLDLGWPLTSVLAFVRSPKGIEQVALEQVIDDPLDPALAYLSERMVFRTRAAGEGSGNEANRS